MQQRRGDGGRARLAQGAGVKKWVRSEGKYSSMEALISGRLVYESGWQQVAGSMPSSREFIAFSERSCTYAMDSSLLPSSPRNYLSSLVPFSSCIIVLKSTLASPAAGDTSLNINRNT